jgi:pyrroline-5-carboxylate reductase
MSAMKISGTLVLLGAGKMGGAMLEGWLAGGVDAARVAVLEPQPSEALLVLQERYGFRLNPDAASIRDAEVILIAVKPQVMDEVLPPVAPMARAGTLILSVVAGKTIAGIARHFAEGVAIIRTIPNTPAAVGRGITAMAASPEVTPAQVRLAEGLLSAIGEVVTVGDESLIDAATAVSGSGPAYVFYLTECLAAAGEKQGLPPDIAEKLARATVAGAGELMRVTGTDAAALRQNVTSPKGTTHAALQVLMADTGLKPLLTEAVAAACARSRELAK